MIKKFFYWPGDWLSKKFTARQRRAIAAWFMILFIIGIPVTYPVRNEVAVIWLMSEVALVLAMWGVVSAETPVEDEEKENDEEHRP